MVSRAALAFLLLAVIAAVHAKPNDLIIGGRQPGDYVLHSEHVTKASTLLSIVKTKKTFTGNNFAHITQIRFLDQNKKGNGARVTVLAGGPNESFVTAEFKSQRGHSINFLVEIYGR